MGTGFSVPIRLGGLEERRKLSHRGPGQSPCRKQISVQESENACRWGVFRKLPSCQKTFVNGTMAQLPQRDSARPTGWVSYGQKWKTGTGRQYFKDITGLPSTTVT